MKPVATRKIVSMILLSVCLFGVGLLMLTSADDSFDTTSEDIADVSYRDLEKDSLYRIENLKVLDRYGELNEGDVRYFLVSFEDKDENTVVASMPVNPESPLWKQTDDYIKDSEAEIGSLTFDGYFETQEFNEDLQNHTQFFREAITTLQEKMWLDFGAKRMSNLSICYVCDLDEDPTTVNAGAAKVGKVVGIVMMALSAWMVFIAIKWMARNRRAKQNVSAPHIAHAASTPHAAPTPHATPTPHTAPVNDIKAELDRYNELVTAGYMTREEFEQKRKELLKL